MKKSEAIEQATKMIKRLNDGYQGRRLMVIEFDDTDSYAVPTVGRIEWSILITMLSNFISRVEEYEDYDFERYSLIILEGEDMLFGGNISQEGFDDEEED